MKMTRRIAALLLTLVLCAFVLVPATSATAESHNAVVSVNLQGERNVPADPNPIPGGWAGAAITIGQQDILLTGLGRMYFTGASLTHSFMVVNPDGSPVVEYCQMTADAATPDSTFAYYTLPANKQVTLKAGQTYYVCSDFWGAEDRFYEKSTVVSSEDVRFVGTVALNGDGSWSMTAAPGINMFPLDLRYKTESGEEPGTAFTPRADGAVRAIELAGERNVATDPAPIVGGWAGTAITVGQEDILLTGLGRMYFTGASLTHSFMVVNPDGSPVVDYFQMTANANTPDSTFAYHMLAADQQVTLKAGQTYYICSDFWGEADRFYDASTVVSTEDVAFTGTVALNGDGSWSMTAAPGANMFPLDLCYQTAKTEPEPSDPVTPPVIVPPDTSEYNAVVTIDLQGERNTKSDPSPVESGWAGTAITVGAKDLRLTSLGRMYFKGASRTHSFMVVNSDGSPVVEYFQMTADSKTADGTFAYYKLPSGKQPVLKAGQTYYICSDFWGASDRFYESSTVTSSADVQFTGTVALNADGSWSMTAAPGVNMFPIDFTYVEATAAPDRTAVTSVQLQGERNVPNDPSPVEAGWAGTAVTIGSEDILLTGLGRMYFDGASRTHSFMVVNPDGSLVVDYCQMTVGENIADSTFAYYTLPASRQVVLKAGQTYYFCSDFWGATDRFYDSSVVTTSEAVQFTGTVALQGGGWIMTSQANANMFPLDFTYTDVPEDTDSQQKPGTNAGQTSNNSAGQKPTHTIGKPETDLPVSEIRNAVLSLELLGQRNHAGDPAPILGGFCGAAITVGDKDIVVTALGRMYFDGANAVHSFLLVDATDGSLLGNPLTVQNYDDSVDGTFEYYYMEEREYVTLKAGHTYYLCSDFYGATDPFYDSSKVVTSDDLRFVGYVELNVADGSWLFNKAADINYLPVDFQYYVIGEEPAVTEPEATEPQETEPAQEDYVEFIPTEDEKQGTVASGGKTNILTWILGGVAVLLLVAIIAALAVKKKKA